MVYKNEIVLDYFDSVRERITELVDKLNIVDANTGVNVQ